MNRSTWVCSVGLAVACLATLYGQWALGAWYIEDAAISFAYARNWGEGWGLVRYPGDERVEGYSNPLWVAMLALGHVVGIDSFDSSKVLAGLLGPVAVVAVFLALYRARVHYVFALAGALVIGTDATYTIWSSSGLENALFGALLALGLWRTIEEGERGGFPWAAVAFLGLAITRPDGIAYAALGGFWALVIEASGPRRWRRIAGWLAVFWVPFAAYHAVRYAYFAFPLPATFYAKIEHAPNWHKFHSYGWKYLGRYCHQTWRLWFLPVFLAGAVSLKGWRALVVALLTLVTGVLVLFPGVEPLISSESWPTVAVPTWWVQTRVYWIFALGLFTPLFAIRSPRWQLRMISWWMLQFGIFFILISNGDWMRGFRWVSLVAVPMALLFSLGLSDVVTFSRTHLGRWPVPALGLGGLTSAVLLTGAVGTQVNYQTVYRPETTPFSVRKRVEHYRWVIRMLDLQRVDILDHDMGAMLYWAGEYGIVRDTKGLSDIAFAYHKRETKFVAEYAWEEYPFDLAHAHATTGRILPRQRDRWRKEYIEFPGYGGRKPHGGNFMRKSLIVHPWEGSTEHQVSFATGVELHGFDMPEPEFSTAFGIQLRYAMSRSNSAHFQLVVFLFDDTGVRSVLAVPQGFARFYPVDDWKRGEVVNQVASAKPPRKLPRGEYRVGAVVIGPDGVLPAETFGPGVSIPDEAVYLPGEVHFSTRVKVVGPNKARAQAKAYVIAATTAAAENRCQEAEETWEAARSKIARGQQWREQHYPEMWPRLAGCWARHAEEIQGRDAQADVMRKALHWDRTQADVLRVGPKISGPWFDEALRKIEAGENELAHQMLVDVIAVDPSRSWARRHLEDLRKVRLGLP